MEEGDFLTQLRASMGKLMADGVGDDSCAHCGAKDAKRCSGCNLAHFCTRACQRAEWSQHKLVCCRDVAYDAEIASETECLAASNAVIDHRCNYCRAEGAQLCTGCNRAFFCNLACQRAGRSKHKPACYRNATADATAMCFARRVVDATTVNAAASAIEAASDYSDAIAHAALVAPRAD